MPLVYRQLRRLAAGHLRRERPNHTLESAAVVNEACLRLVDQRKVHWQNRAHFFGIAPRIYAGDSGGARAKPSDREARTGS
jgi:ECF sigma factor